MSGIAAVAATIAIAFLLLGIDEIGVQIEEPFAILPLSEPSILQLTKSRSCLSLRAWDRTQVLKPLLKCEVC